MKVKLMVPMILSILLALALIMVVAVYAQEPAPGDEREKVEEGGKAMNGLSDPPPAGYTVLYTFTGAKDTQAGGTNSAATAVHCTNAGAASVKVWVQISDFDNTPTISGTLTIPPSGTRTYSSQLTSFYAEDFTMSTTDNIDQGSGRVMAKGSSSKVICTAQVLDPVGNPPNYVINLDLFRP